MGSQDLASQLKRVWQLIELLPSASGALTPKELWGLGCDRHQWSTSDRTIHRDLLALKTLRIAKTVATAKDLLTCDERAKRWYRVPAKDLGKARLSTDQALALLLIERAADRLLPAGVIHALKPQFAQAHQHLDVYKKVNPQLRWADKVAVIDCGIARAPKAINLEVLNSLQQALLEDKQVKCRYRALDKGKSKVCVLEPRALVQQGPVLYIVATRADRPQYEPGWYVLHRFVSAKPLPEAVTARRFSLKEFLAKGGADYGANGRTVALRARLLSRAIRKRLREAPLAADQQFFREPKGTVVTATVRPSFPLETWLLSVADDLVVLEPAELREKVAKRLQTASSAYGDPVLPSSHLPPSKATLQPGLRSPTPPVPRPPFRAFRSQPT